MSMLLLMDKHTDLEIENVLTVGLTANAQTPDSVVAFTATLSENVRKALGVSSTQKPTEKYYDMHNYSPHSIKTNAVQVASATAIY